MQSRIMFYIHVQNVLLENSKVHCKWWLSNMVTGNDKTTIFGGGGFPKVLVGWIKIL